MSESKPVDTKNEVENKQENQVENVEEKYAILQETSGEESESWLYFIRYTGNEKNLKHLQEQLESVDWYIVDDLSTFDLELDHLVCARTAKEMTKVDLNSHSFHRKFDGVLDKIDFNLKHKDKNEKKMIKVFDILGYGQIEDYIDKEDIDESDLVDCSSSSSSESEDDTRRNRKHESSDSDGSKKKRKEKGKGKVPPVLDASLPNFAKLGRAKHKNRHKK